MAQMHLSDERSERFQPVLPGRTSRGLATQHEATWRSAHGVQRGGIVSVRCGASTPAASALATACEQGPAPDAANRFAKPLLHAPGTVKLKNGTLDIAHREPYRRVYVHVDPHMILELTNTSKLPLVMPIPRIELPGSISVRHAR